MNGKTARAMRKIEDRELIRAKFGGRCAYCGQLLDKVFHIDHVAPIFRGWDTKPSRAGEDTSDNLVPACPRCNRWKSTYTLEDFRFEISKQIERMRRDSPSFRLAEDFGQVVVINKPIVFWFEKYGK